MTIQFLLAGLLLLPAGAPPVTLHLGEGTSITGQLLKETEDAVWIDLGFDVVRVPAARIVRREDSAASRPGVRIFEEELFARAELPEISIVEGARRVGEAVVKVATDEGFGSGFLISSDGHLVTNFHVVRGETEASVTLYLQGPSGFELKTVRKVKVLSANPDMDLALLKMDPPEGVTLKRVFIGESAKVQVGDRVYAIGTPIGLERTVSAGIVSVTNRTLGGRIHLQITAAINPGNSGGPLFNLRGEVVGVTSSKIMGVGLEGLNFAIPSSYVVDFLRNRDAFAVDPSRTKDGIHYLPAPRRPRAESTPK